MDEARDWIPLKDAPARLLNAEAWQKLVQLQGSENAALACLKISSAFFDMDCNWSVPGTLECVSAIRAAMADEIRAGKIVAQGTPPDSIGSPVNVDRSHVDRMKFDFPKNEIHVDNVICRDVSVARAVAAEDNNVEIVEWLKNHRDDASKGKIWLLDKAIKDIGSRVTQRGFSAAYTEVFGRTRGRPRKNNQIID